MITPVQRIVREAKLAATSSRGDWYFTGRACWFIRVSWAAATMCRTKAASRPMRSTQSTNVRGKKRVAELAEPLAVLVEVLGAEEQLEVADHVGEDEAQQDDPGERHDPLLADRRALEPEQRVARRGGPRDGRRCTARARRRRRRRALVRGRDLYLRHSRLATSRTGSAPRTGRAVVTETYALGLSRRRYGATRGRRRTNGHLADRPGERT